MSNLRFSQNRGPAALAGQRSGASVPGAGDSSASAATPQPRTGENFVQLLMVVPHIAPIYDDAHDGETVDPLDNPAMEEKLKLIRDNSRVSAKIHSRGVVAMGAPSKGHMQKGVAGLVHILSQEDPGLLMYHPAHLVQIPSAGRDNFLLKRVQHDIENKGGERIAIPNRDGIAPTYRFITDRPSDQPRETTDQEQGLEKEQVHEFELYTHKFMCHMDDVAARLRSTPDEMRMRVNLGALMQYQYPKNMDLTSATVFEGMIGHIMRRATFFYNKDISYHDRDIGALNFAARVRMAIEASPDLFSPANSRIETLAEVPVEHTVVVFTKDWRLEMKYQNFTSRLGGRGQFQLVQPTVFRREHKNKEKAIISVNPEGSYDWSLEILVEEGLENMSDFFRNMHQHVKLGLAPDGTLLPRLSAQVVQGAKVTGITTKSARIYLVDDASAPYHVEVAAYKDWNLETGACIWQSCSMSFYAMDWVDILDKRNIAFNPRDFGPCHTTLLPVTPDQAVEEGGARFLRLVKRLQDFLERVRKGDFDKPSGDGTTPGAGGGPPGKPSGKVNGPPGNAAGGGKRAGTVGRG